MADVTDDGGREAIDGGERRSRLRSRIPSAGPDGDPDRDRAQLILITGLTLAVLFVAVVLLLNTVIYTENLATRGIDSGGGEAIEFRENVATDVGEIMDRGNRNNETDRTNFTMTVGNYTDRVRDHRIRDGDVAEVTLDEASIVEGWYVADDDETRTFRADDGYAGTDDGNWTVADNVTRTRGYRMTIDAASVHELDETGGETAESDAFAVVADSGVLGASWTAYVYRQEGHSNVTVSIDDGGGRVDRTVEPDADGNVSLDLTAGTVNGEGWDALVWADGVETGDDRYSIRYEHGDRAAGTYEFTVNDAGFGGIIEEDQFGSPRDDTSSSPYALDAVYSANVTVDRQTTELRYGDRVRVAPGERDD